MMNDATCGHLAESSPAGAPPAQIAEPAAQKPAPVIDVAKLAGLARLRLPENEREALQRDMEDIVAFAGTLAVLDTTGAEPMNPAAPLHNVMRDDVVTPSLPRDELLAAASQTLDGYFVVPNLLETAMPEAVAEHEV